MNEAKQRMLTSLKNNLVQLDEARIHAKMDHDRDLADGTKRLKKKYDDKMAEIALRQAGVEEEIRSVESYKE
jgi:hypothetical protein